MKKRPTLMNSSLRGLQERDRVGGAIGMLAEKIAEQWAKQSNLHPVVLLRNARRLARRRLGIE